MEYHLSAGAILYSVLCAKREGIYGVRNVLATVSREEYPLFVQNAEMELMDKGLGCMDCDGTFGLEPEFMEVIGACGDCSTVLSAAVRREHRERLLTGYLINDVEKDGADSGADIGGTEKMNKSNGRNVILEQVGDTDYVLRTEADILSRTMEFLNLPERENVLAETSVDSGLIQRRDFDGLLAAGCSEEMARLVIASAKGVGGYAQIGRVHEKQRTDLVTLLCGPDGIVTAQVEYPVGSEMFRLTPVTVEEARELVGKLIRQ